MVLKGLEIHHFMVRDKHHFFWCITLPQLLWGALVLGAWAWKWSGVCDWKTELLVSVSVLCYEFAGICFQNVSLESLFTIILFVR